MLPKWQKHLPHKLYSQPHLPIETTNYGKAWRAFCKQNFGLCSTTYYSTVPITCTQKRIYRTQFFITINRWGAVRYDILLQLTSLQRYIVCFPRYCCKEVSLEWYLDEISRRLYWYLADLSYPWDVTLINRERSEQTLFSLIIICITFSTVAQYCRLQLRTDKLPVLTLIFLSVLH